MASDQSIRDKFKAAQQKIPGYASGWATDPAYQMPGTGGKMPPSFTGPEWESQLPSGPMKIREQERRNREADYAKNNKNTGEF